MALTAASPSVAGVNLVKLDWTTPGDNARTLDESTGLKWLDLSQPLNLG